MSLKSRSPDKLFSDFGFTDYDEQKDAFLATKEFALRQIRLDCSRKFVDRPIEEQTRLVTEFVRNAAEYMRDNKLHPYTTFALHCTLISSRSKSINESGCRQYLINKCSNKIKATKTKQRAKTKEKARKGRPRKQPEPTTTRHEPRKIAPSIGEHRPPYDQVMNPYTTTMSAYNDDTPIERSFSNMVTNFGNQPTVKALIQATY